MRVFNRANVLTRYWLKKNGALSIEEDLPPKIIGYPVLLVTIIFVIFCAVNVIGYYKKESDKIVDEYLQLKRDHKNLLDKDIIDIYSDDNDYAEKITQQHKVSVRNLELKISEKRIKNYFKGPKNVLDQIRTFGPVFVQQFNSGIAIELPSVRMAQLMLESGHLSSPLYKKSANLFGIKCHNKAHKKSTYKGNHCVQFADDKPNDRFKNYPTKWDSIEDHRKKINSSYSDLEKYADYRTQAYYLKSAGYATDPKYAEKLISIIEKYKLYNLDNPKLNIFP